jgi:calcium-translocating P-type ATPase
VALLALDAPPRLVHAVAGRVRVHLPGWGGERADQLTLALRRLPGVVEARVSGVSGNALLRYDPVSVTADALLAEIARLELPAPRADAPPPSHDRRPAGPRVVAERHPSTPEDARRRVRRARIAVRGLDRDPDVARRVVERLAGRAGVTRAVASPLTGRVLVEFSHDVVRLQDLLDEVSDVELPDVPAADHPTHPLDPAPLVQGTARLVGAGLGLGLLLARRASGAAQLSVGGSAPAAVSGTIGILEGLPPARAGLRELLGRDRAELLLGGVGIASLTLAGSPLGLALAGAGALRLVTEVRARQAAWRAYERRLAQTPPVTAGQLVRLEPGQRVAMRARVVEGHATGIGRDALPCPVRPGAELQAGTRVLGGVVVAELLGEAAFTPAPRPAPPPAGGVERYIGGLGPVALAYAGLTALVRRSPVAAFTGLLLVNPRPALIGADAADLGASARVLRAGVTVVGTRPARSIRLPDVLLVDGPRVLADGWELVRVISLEDAPAQDPVELARAVAGAAGSPWGGALGAVTRTSARDGRFDGRTASARVGEERYALEPVDGELGADPRVARRRDRGEHVLVLREAGEGRPLALVVLRPRLAPGLAELVEACRRHRVELVLLERGARPAARALAGRTDVPLVVEADLVALVRERQAAGARVAVLSDSAAAAPAFDAADLAIGLSSGRGGPFAARADLLAPDLTAVASVVEAGARREDTARLAVGFSLAANVAGGLWGLQGAPGIARASRATYLAALSALAAGWARLRGGRRSRSVAARLTDPRPERWGRRSPQEALAALRSTPEGLSEEEALTRRRRGVAPVARPRLWNGVLEQLRSPLTGLLAAGGALSLALGAAGDVVVIGAVIAANALVGAWQEREAGRAAEALDRLGAAAARVLRGGRLVSVPADQVVPGDVLQLAAGDRVVADARLLAADGLELDEAALTGESMPVGKAVAAGSPEARVVLEGSDVLVGTGRAVAVAVGPGTRLGATAQALALDEGRESPLGQRLQRLLAQLLPVVAAGGALVAVSGIAWGGAPGTQVALGASIALAAVPEGLPLLAGVAQAAVARRLARRRALVRRLAAVEALGRVDVACCDKTGTLTLGRLRVGRVADLETAAPFPGRLPGGLTGVLRTAAIASPRPDGPDARAHPTDVAILEAAERGGVGDAARAAREREVAFEPTRSYHAAVAEGRACFKGAAEVLAPRCASVRREGREEPLDEAGRRRLLARADALAAEGLRVLLVAQGASDTDLQRPGGLVALGFVGIQDPLRGGVASAVARCQAAGVRLVMLTGDHPSTARTIAREAGLRTDGDAVLTGEELASLENEELEARLERAAVIARITPLDKLRIVEALQRAGHTVAMTGDGVNDAPALRLADVGVAMGRGGTEVARQAADVVLADDEFATLVEALVEGRGFWRNMRRALGLLLGGNLGELALVAGASVLGLGAPLTARQILAVNLVTDVFPATAVAVQPPAHRELGTLVREGSAGLDRPLRAEIARRGAATGATSLAAFAAARPLGGAQAGTVAFASVVLGQLTQTLDLGRAQGTLSPPVLGAVGGSVAALAAAVALPPLRGFLGLAAPTPAGLALVLAASLAAALLGRALPLGGATPPPRLALPAPAAAP